ncbi:hypothetical protein [Streptomyces sp. NBC_00525]|uniref:hypothetical protein n=1 Tax=Streptomyces sp. NBC_00525 TaxID=2903660 RepID=UPI002E7FF190|nr:hypothetical protein [Streptomyces sp. NBC_00525]WUC97194.1 hypothetical protein OG710_27870 [Streptomyces sp. NBC_00525]
MKSVRSVGVCALLALLAACGGNTPAPEPSPSAPPPVSLDLKSVSAPEDTELGLALDLSNEGRELREVVVRVRVGSLRGGDPAPKMKEKKEGGGWRSVALEKDGKGFTGTYRIDLPRGDTLRFVGITPRVKPRIEGDELPVDVTVLDGSRTLARERHAVRPATLALISDTPDKQPAPLGRGTWTEVTYTVVNHSLTAYPQAKVRADFMACTVHAPVPQPCSGAEAHGVSEDLRVQYYDGARWKDVSASDGASLLAGVFMPLGELPADSERAFRLRFTGTGELDGESALLTLDAWVVGQAAGASKGSMDQAPNVTFALR